MARWPALTVHVWRRNDAQNGGVHEAGCEDPDEEHAEQGSQVLLAREVGGRRDGGSTSAMQYAHAMHVTVHVATTTAARTSMRCAPNMRRSDGGFAASRMAASLSHATHVEAGKCHTPNTATASAGGVSVGVVPRVGTPWLGQRGAHPIANASRSDSRCAASVMMARLLAMLPPITSRIMNTTHSAPAYFSCLIACVARYHGLTARPGVRAQHAHKRQPHHRTLAARSSAPLPSPWSSDA